MTRTAVISDIHGNLEALTSVLSDIDREGASRILCLGDIVGYGPDPIACTDLVRERCEIVVCGNHDEALVKGAWGFSPLARDAIDWTRKLMRPGLFRRGAKARWEFLASLPLTAEWEDILLVHGSPRDPTTEYVMPHEVNWPPPRKFEEIFAAFPSVCLIGHTHYAGVFREGPQFSAQSEILGSFQREGAKLLINVGSVGQPRDRNWRASYLLIDDCDRFTFRRIEYDLATTQEKIRRIEELDDRLADRLGRGE